MLIPRLVFGCARLTGGAEARHAAALIDRALSADIRAFDTAPPYGMGTAEQALGRALHGRTDVAIVTKIGLPRPSHPWLRSHVRRAKSLLLTRSSLLEQPFVPPGPPPARGAGDFDPARMEASIVRSLDYLARERIDMVLLHEAGSGDARPEVMAFLEDLRAAGLTERVGYSHGAPFDADTDAAFPETYVAQAGLPADWATATPSSRAVTWHSVGRHGLHAARGDPRLHRALGQARERIGRIDVSDRSHELAALYALVHARWPEARLIVASTDRDRLDQLLRAIAHVDAAIDPAVLRGDLAAEGLMPRAA